MKKTVALLLVAILMLASVSAMAWTWNGVGSHPSQGDKGGVRAAIIAASIGRGGEMLNQAAISGLGLTFSEVGKSNIVVGGAYKMLINITKGWMK